MSHFSSQQAVLTTSTPEPPKHRAGWLLAAGCAVVSGVLWWRHRRHRRHHRGRVVHVDTSASQSIVPRLLAEAKQLGLSVYSEEFARAMDDKDELASYRNRFHIPKASPHTEDQPASIYLCGNSLGLQPTNCSELLEQEMKKWRNMGVEGHFKGDIKWALVDEYVTPLMAKVVGAHPQEVAIMNSLSVNLHLMMISFYRPSGKRYKIMMEKNAFCSDHHVVRSQVELHLQGQNRGVMDSLILLEPRPNEHYLRTEDIISQIEKHANEIELILLPGVQFYTGQAFDMGAIAQAAQRCGCNFGLDLAHAVGNVELKLHEWGVDFACWCSYKYLNSGPGAIAGAFLHERHATKSNRQLPRLCGWWGQTPESRFAMKPEWDMLPGAQSYMLSNPAVLPTVCLLASLQVFKDATMPRLRAKSLLLTGLLEALLHEFIPEQYGLRVITPRDPTSRGCQLSLLLAQDVRKVQHYLESHGVICDVREPDVMRIAPTPLYNSFADVHRFVCLLRHAMDSVRSSN